MKKILLSPFLAFLGCVGFLLLPFSLFAGTGEGVDVSLVFDASMPLVPGQPFMAVVVLDLKPGWHTYWRYPGDSGVPPKVIWHLPPGWNVGPLEFSIPNQFSEPGDMLIYGYEKRQLLRAVITPPKEIPKDQPIELKASLSWLACKELCVPGSTEVSCEISGPTTKIVRWLSSYVSKGEWPTIGLPPFSVSISAKGGNKAISFTGQGGATYELYPDPSEGTTVGHVTRLVSEGAEGPAVVFSIPWDGPSPFHALLVESTGDSRQAWWIGGSLRNSAGSSEHAGISFGVLIAALFSGFLGGLILNLMPCVLPVISLKIFSFIAQAGESPKRIFCHGLAFAAGIFIWFLGLGLLVIALKAGGSQVTWGAFQFQNPLFVVGLSVLVFLFALNLFGLFEITLPGSATTSLDHTARREGYGGSFFQGLFATLLATPCTAPFLGSALGFAFGQSSLVILAMFASVALGMSLPYLVLSAQPGWRKWIPKPGVWMERLKQFMGFPLLATNLWLLWVLQNQRGNEAALTLLALFLILGFCAWLFGILSVGGSRAHVVYLSLIVLLALAAIAFAAQRIRVTQAATLKTSGAVDGIAWVPYTPEALTALRAEGKPVFLDFTASWCLTCQFNERTAINVPAVRQFIKEREIIAMKGDWTNADPAITAALKSFGRVGVPLAVYYPPGKGSDPIVLPELLTQKIVIDALTK
jgi:thiol:disulfide interchange protein DsbD